MSLQNHYETLNVARNASALEILASYNILKKMFGADPQMATELDQAVTVLSDEAARSAYDQLMVRAMNKKAALSELPKELPPLPVMMTVPMEEMIATQIRERKDLNELNKDVTSRFLAIACSLVIVASAIFAISSNKDVLSRIGLMTMEDIVQSQYVRSATAPNGQAFPETTSYIAGYEILENTGKSTLAIENMKNESDVYLKLLSHKNGKVGVARHVLIKAGSNFTVDNLSIGKYEIQYLDLTAGKGGRSEIFTVTESKTEAGTEIVSRLSVRLKTAVNGVLRVEKVSTKAFDSLAAL